MHWYFRPYFRCSMENDFIKKLSNLSRINVSSNNEKKFKKFMNEVIDYTKTLDRIADKYKKARSLEDTNALHNKQFNILREDKSVKSNMDRHTLLKNAPNRRESYFIVPALFNREYDNVN